jgi:serine protease Do
MSTRCCAAAVAVVMGVVLAGAGTEARAEGTSRVTPIVEAVRKTRDSIITVKVQRGGSWAKKDTVGTGVIVDERGYAVTNCHVVHNADHISVVLAGRREVSCKVLFEDSSHDLAILRLEVEKSMPALTFAPASDLMVGETVIAIGHPFGYTNTVSTGIVSALDRHIMMPEGEILRNLIQTNASINPGNSGGPLLNVNGELIGINVALREGAQGIAFALNADTVQQVLSKLLSAERIAHLGHGLSCREVVPEGEGVRQQVVVDAVTPKGPAERAGVKAGDVILKVGDRPVTNRFDLERALWGYKPGQKVQAAILRDGKQTEAQIRLARLRDADEVTPASTKE